MYMCTYIIALSCRALYTYVFGVTYVESELTWADEGLTGHYWGGMEPSCIWQTFCNIHVSNIEYRRDISTYVHDCLLLPTIDQIYILLPTICLLHIISSYTYTLTLQRWRCCNNPANDNSGCHRVWQSRQAVSSGRFLALERAVAGVGLGTYVHKPLSLGFGTRGRIRLQRLRWCSNLSNDSAGCHRVSQSRPAVVSGRLLALESAVADLGFGP